jgi:hypothetical protein
MFILYHWLIYHSVEEKEQEIEIGNPTDVKHVAHIGWDGPTDNNNPSWVSLYSLSNILIVN